MVKPILACAAVTGVGFAVALAAMFVRSFNEMLEHLIDTD